MGAGLYTREYPRVVCTLPVLFPRYPVGAPFFLYTGRSRTEPCTHVDGAGVNDRFDAVTDVLSVFNITSEKRHLRSKTSRKDQKTPLEQRIPDITVLFSKECRMLRPLFPSQKHPVEYSPLFHRPICRLDLPGFPEVFTKVVKSCQKLNIPVSQKLSKDEYPSFSK